MSVNGASNGKAPAQEPQQSHRPERGLVKVQPARLDDLQPRYASKIQHEQENSEAHGWYARLSKCFGPGNQTRPRLTTASHACSPQPGRVPRFLRSYPLLPLLPEPLQARRTG